MAPLYITTPIYYVNGDPHIGHAHTSIMGDILKRCHLMRGEKVLYSTGTDEHGQKNQEAIEKSNLGEEGYLSQQSNRFRKLFDRLNVSYDIYVRTSNPSHKKAVGAFLTRLYDAGLIYKKDYSGLYCVGCEQFKKVTDLDSEGRCPDHLAKPVTQTETNYFFKLSQFQDWLMDALQKDDDLIAPENYRKEVLAMLNEPLEDLCISRPKSRVWLGIELPFDRDFVTYVWFDALLNYISNLNFGENDQFEEWWDYSMHIMAKDIIKTHIIYWPIMLKAAGIKMPHRYRIHGYWVGEGGQKMSKSLGNVVDPNGVVDRVGVDGLRFYLARTMGGNDAQISENLIVSAYNTDLANNIGNLHARVVKFAGKRTGFKIPTPREIFSEDARLQRKIIEIVQPAFESLDLITIPNYVQAALNVADLMNLHFNDIAPWKLAKEAGQEDRLSSVLYVMMDSIRILYEFLWPVIPESANKALSSIGAKEMTMEPCAHQFISGGLVPGNPFLDSGVLFPRLS